MNGENERLIDQHYNVAIKIYRVDTEVSLEGELGGRGGLETMDGDSGYSGGAQEDTEARGC